MQLFATFVKNKCNFFNFLLQQKLALMIIYHQQRKSLANDKSLKDVTYIHKKTASLALIVTLHVAWPKRVGIYSKLIKQDNKENIHHRI